MRTAPESDPQANKPAVTVLVIEMKQATGRRDLATVMRAATRTMTDMKQMKMIAAPVQRGRRERQPEAEVVERGSRGNYKDGERRREVVE